jgi:DNA-binding GntR family transcriptional regulator
VAPNVTRQEPPYLQIAEDIRRRVRSGELRDGDLVPSTRQLARDWSVSVPTAAKALAALRSEGYVRGVPGTGTIVCANETVHHTDQDRMLAIRRTGRIYGPDERAVITAAELVPASEGVAAALRVEPGVPVIRRHRITLRNDVPETASTSWFSGDLAEAAPLLLTAERIRSGTPGYIEQVTGRSVAAGLDQHSARPATEQDAADLSVPAGSPVACGKNWYYDPEGNVIEYGESVSIPGRWGSHHYTIPRDESQRA